MPKRIPFKRVGRRVFHKAPVKKRRTITLGDLKRINKGGRKFAKEQDLKFEPHTKSNYERKFKVKVVSGN